MLCPFSYIYSHTELLYNIILLKSTEIDRKVAKKFAAALFLPHFSRFFTKSINFREWRVNKMQNAFTFSPRRDKIKINKIKIHMA